MHFSPYILSQWRSLHSSRFHEANSVSNVIIILARKIAGGLQEYWIPMADMVLSVDVPECNSIVFKLETLASVSYINLCMRLFTTSDGSESFTSPPSDQLQDTIVISPNEKPCII